MRQGRGRGKIRNPDYFIYTASCLDIRSLEGNPKLISWCGERILPPNLPDPDPIYAGMPKIPRTADEAKALCEEAERLNRLPAAIAKPASDVAPPARDGLDIPEYLRRTAP
jgi:hypothetical protein